MVTPDEVDQRLALEINALPDGSFPICLRVSTQVAAAMYPIPHFQPANEPFPSGGSRDPASHGICVGWWHVLPVLLDMSLGDRQLQIILDEWDFLDD